MVREAMLYLNGDWELRFGYLEGGFASFYGSGSHGEDGRGLLRGLSLLFGGFLVVLDVRRGFLALPLVLVTILVLVLVTTLVLFVVTILVLILGTIILVLFVVTILVLIILVLVVVTILVLALLTILVVLFAIFPLVPKFIGRDDPHGGHVGPGDLQGGSVQGNLSQDGAIGGVGDQELDEAVGGFFVGADDPGVHHVPQGGKGAEEIPMTRLGGEAVNYDGVGVRGVGDAVELHGLPLRFFYF